MFSVNKKQFLLLLQIMCGWEKCADAVKRKKRVSLDKTSHRANSTTRLSAENTSWSKDEDARSCIPRAWIRIDGKWDVDLRTINTVQHNDGSLRWSHLAIVRSRTARQCSSIPIRCVRHVVHHFSWCFVIFALDPLIDSMHKKLELSAPSRDKSKEQCNHPRDQFPQKYLLLWLNCDPQVRYQQFWLPHYIQAQQYLWVMMLTFTYARIVTHALAVSHTPNSCFWFT